jgi:hypothetical protein
LASVDQSLRIARGPARAFLLEIRQFTSTIRLLDMAHRLLLARPIANGFPIVYGEQIV